MSSFITLWVASQQTGMNAVLGLEYVENPWTEGLKEMAVLNLETTHAVEKVC
jgi:hypothetical protein